VDSRLPKLLPKVRAGDIGKGEGPKWQGMAGAPIGFKTWK
jgi:hypothetical protein